MSGSVEIATLITAITGLATAIVALWNIKELRLMRAVSSKPSLIATNFEFVVRCKEDSEADFGASGELPAIGVINFGNGPAVHCEATWNIPDERLIELLRSYDPYDQFKIGFEQSPFADDPCLRLYWNHFVKRQVQWRINPIVPSVSGEAITLNIPPYYLEAFHMYVRLAVHARPENDIYFPVRSFPEAKLIVTFKDLADQPQIVRYRVFLAYNHNATYQQKEPRSYACSLNVFDEARSEKEI